MLDGLEGRAGSWGAEPGSAGSRDRLRDSGRLHVTASDRRTDDADCWDLTPQAWAVDAWTRLLSQHGTLASIAPHLLVLAGFASVFLALATWRLHRRLS